MLIIDGAAGEGGGQILRTALALSAVTASRFESRGSAARGPSQG
jgi:RNA 3'-terminal phosphate cyclase